MSEVFHGVFINYLTTSQKLQLVEFRYFFMSYFFTFLQDDDWWLYTLNGKKKYCQHFLRVHGPFVIIPNQLVRSLCVSRRGGCAIGSRTNGRGRVVSSGQGLLYTSCCMKARATCPPPTCSSIQRDMNSAGRLSNIAHPDRHGGIAGGGGGSRCYVRPRAGWVSQATDWWRRSSAHAQAGACAQAPPQRLSAALG